MKRMYVDIADLSKAIDWLKSKPEGELGLLIYAEDVKEVTPKLMKAITKSGRSQAEWIVKKIQTKQLDVKATHEKADLPIGEVLEDEQ